MNHGSTEKEKKQGLKKILPFPNPLFDVKLKKSCIKYTIWNIPYYESAHRPNMINQSIDTMYFLTNIEEAAYMHCKLSSFLKTILLFECLILKELIRSTILYLRKLDC